MTDELKDLSERDLLLRIAQELTSIRKLTSKAVNALHEAESEVPESMRRFITYMHDLHDVCFMYESRGQPAPNHVLREMERCDDRYRQLIEKHKTDGGAFEKVIREMAGDPKNRWDHAAQLPKPKESE